MAQTAEQAGQSQYFSPAAFLCSACTRNAFAPSSPIYSAASGVPRKEYMDKSTGELVNSNDIKPMLDEEKIEAYKKFFNDYGLRMSSSDYNFLQKQYLKLTQ